MRSSSAPTRRCTSTIWSGGSGASGTTEQSRGRGRLPRHRRVLRWHDRGAVRVGACRARPHPCLPRGGSGHDGSAGRPPWPRRWPATLLGVPSPRRRPALAAPADAEPLIVHLDSITPAALGDDDDPVEITGTVTNQSAEPWTDSTSTPSGPPPRSSTPTLAGGVRGRRSRGVGGRPGRRARHLRHRRPAPARADHRLLAQRAPRAARRSCEPGAYWIGVHAIGDSSVPRDAFADGKARTFIPLRRVLGRGHRRRRRRARPRPGPPHRERPGVRRPPLGHVPRRRRAPRRRARRRGGVGRHPDQLAGRPGGAGHRRAAGGRQPEPQPGRRPGPGAEAPRRPRRSRRQEPGAGVAEAPFPPTGGAPLGPPAPEELSDDKQAVATVAQAWLDRFTALVAGETVLSLPYGDLDVSAAATHGPVFYTDAMARGAEVMTALGIAHTPVLAPPDGLLSPDALQAATDEQHRPARRHVVRRPAGRAQLDGPAARPQGGRHVVRGGIGRPGTHHGRRAARPAPAAAQRGGPAPLRRVHRSGGPRAPRRLVPPGPGRPLQRLRRAVARPGHRHRRQRPLGGRPHRRRPQLHRGGRRHRARRRPASPPRRRCASRRRSCPGCSPAPTSCRSRPTDEALATLSVRQRPREAAAAASARAAAGYLDDQLAGIDVVAPPSVTLSSEDGTLGPPSSTGSTSR